MIKKKVVFDSSAKNYGLPMEDYSYLEGLHSGTISRKDGITNIIKNDTFDFITAGIISNDELYSDINPIKGTMYVIAAIFFIIALTLTYFNTKVFSRRVARIISAIKAIQHGHFHTRIKFSNNEDEMGQISQSLNFMCEKLSEYIEKEYVTDLKRKEAEIKQRDAELYALQSQINPHFLYNTLEAIRMKALALGENDVSKMIRILADLFRSSVKKGTVIEICEEISYCKSYLELFNIRYGNKLEIRFEIDDEILRYGIIRHILQPLIENSIIHGINLNREDNLITIKGQMAGENIIFSICDNGNGMDEDRFYKLSEELKNPSIYTEKIGLLNANHRIKMIYGDVYGLEIVSLKDMGTTVTMKILAKFKEELKDYVQGINS